MFPPKIQYKLQLNTYHLKMGLSHKNLPKIIFENECKPFVIEPTPVKIALWG